jgi:hypothetical protein
MMRGSPFRFAGWLVVAGLLGAAIIAPSAALATKPDPGHKVTICHATNSDSNPYRAITVDIASSGYVKSGHADHTGPVWDATLKARHISWGDIIPSYTYGTFAYPGLNWNAQGQAIWNADCTIPKTNPTVPPTPTPTPTSAQSQAASVVPSGSVEAETGTLQPSGSVEAATGALATLPATDVVRTGAATVSTDAWRVLLLVMAVVLGAALALTPAGSRRR